MRLMTVVFISIVQFASVAVAQDETPTLQSLHESIEATNAKITQLNNRIDILFNETSQQRALNARIAGLEVELTAALQKLADARDAQSMAEKRAADLNEQLAAASAEYEATLAAEALKIAEAAAELEVCKVSLQSCQETQAPPSD